MALMTMVKVIYWKKLMNSVIKVKSMFSYRYPHHHHQDEEWAAGADEATQTTRDGNST